MLTAFMKSSVTLVLLLSALHYLLATPESSKKLRAECTGNSEWSHCRPATEIAKLVADLRGELALLHTKHLINENCTVCWNDPCQHDGDCVPISDTEYRCDCLPNYTGNNCETLVECKSDSCGVNAICFVAHHQINCICQEGYAGDPIAGCHVEVINAGMAGDPHFKTFDGQYYDYMGTCPYHFLLPCGQQFPAPFEDFSVRAKNELSFPNAHVSTLSEVEVNLYGHKFHIDSSYKLYVDGIHRTMPYAYPNTSQPKVTVTYKNFHVMFRDKRELSIFFSYGMLDVKIPDIPLFWGENVICGLAGNRDKNCKNDFRTRDGNVVTPAIDSCRNRFQSFTEHFGDTYITQSFLTTKPEALECVPGVAVTAHRNQKCDEEEYSKLCEPISQAGQGIGPFSNCSKLGATMIADAFSDCVNDVCQRTSLVCNSFSFFAKLCQSRLPNVMFVDWHKELDCPHIHCPLHSKYHSCASGCPATCANPVRPEICTENCMEGCECELSYLLDTSIPSKPECKLPSECGCSDADGNYNSAQEPWLTKSCTVINNCEDGRLVSRQNNCSEDAECLSDLYFDYRCQCNKGYEGDGYTCEDIDECEDSYTCNADKGHGTCTNTPGSYYCTCDEYYGGKECERYQPLRHCADIYKYHGKRQSGVQTIKLRKETVSGIAYVPVDVYCDMETEEDGHIGGWTLLSNTADNLMSGKTFQEYVDGFGDTANREVWLGLENMHVITNNMPMSLRLHLNYCGPRRRLVHTYCTYATFAVRKASKQYAIVLPNQCEGNNSALWDGWMRWVEKVGPPFVAFDNDPGNCSSYFFQTGWWFDHSQLCGVANLNGVRYACDDEPPVNRLGAHIRWNNNPISHAEMLMRPANFPNYEPSAPPAVATTLRPDAPTASATTNDDDDDGTVSVDHDDGTVSANHEHGTVSADHEHGTVSADHDDGTVSADHEHGTVSADHDHGTVSADHDHGTVNADHEHGTVSAYHDHGTVSADHEHGTVSAYHDHGTVSADHEHGTVSAYHDHGTVSADHEHGTVSAYHDHGTVSADHEHGTVTTLM